MLFRSRMITYCLTPGDESRAFLSHCLSRALQIDRAFSREKWKLASIGSPVRRRYNNRMQIHTLIWPEDRVEHIARHNVTPAEVEEVCFGWPLVLRAKRRGPNPVYHVLGKTLSGRYLLCIVICFPDGKGYPITARTMTEKEKQRFTNWLNQ